MGRNDHLPCERFSQFNDEHPEFGETMPNLLDCLPSAPTASAKKCCIRPANRVATQPEPSWRSIPTV